jgi:hypothetical protein
MFASLGGFSAGGVWIDGGKGLVIYIERDHIYPAVNLSRGTGLRKGEQNQVAISIFYNLKVNFIRKGRQNGLSSSYICDIIHLSYK